MSQDTCWESYWKEFIRDKKLENFVTEMNQVDDQLHNEFHIEEICHKIYEDYQNSWKNHLEDVRVNFLKELEKFKHVHLQTSRVKQIDSLLEKVVTKRYKSLRSSHSLYAKINGDNYKDIITDLVGMRIILNYRGNWKDIHQEILNRFSYRESLFQDEDTILPHTASGDNILAQIPHVNYAHGDDIEEFQKYGLITKLKSIGYRSIHYIISYQKTYIELQVRTIYDEAWSDCDHNYVYKKDMNKSHSALLQLSHILCCLTNISNDMGENMKEIFETQSFEDIGNNAWLADERNIKKIDLELKRLYDVYEELRTFRSQIQINSEVEKHGKEAAR